MKKVIQNIRDHTKNYLSEAGLKSMVLGVSGGIDSAVVAALMKPVALDLGIELYGISMPTTSNKEDEEKRADVVMEQFCTKSMRMDIGPEVEELEQSLNILMKNLKIEVDLMAYKIALGNIKARIRMITLYSLAGLTKGLVLSTDNWTELMLGFWTLHGDVGDYGAIQNLTKSEVYLLADWLVRNEIQDLQAASVLTRCMDAVPTDGLGITESDYDQLGHKSYTDIDTVLQAWLHLDGLEIKSVMEKVDHETLSQDPAVLRHKATEFKRNNPYNIPRHILWNGV